MPIRLFNTLSRSLDVFTPEDPARVRMYVCGPTVYDDAHIGNARPVVVFDVLFRLLRHVYGAEAVHYARNVTDVDDKINARAARDFPDLEINAAIRTLTGTTEDRFKADARALGCLDPTYQPRATDNIDGMIAITARLLDNGHAYVAGGEVLFSVPSMPDYGRLSDLGNASLKAGARIEVDGHKRDPRDFVLWKASSDHEPGWESPWGRGRPGWHIECSAMSARYLGETFDIHGGGLDLSFPHHENEIAQSRCAHGTDRMASYWLHNGFVMLDGHKMSKSEGNFVTIHQLLRTNDYGGRAWPGETLRLAMLMTSYREPIDFTADRLEEARSILAGWPLTVETEADPAPEVVARLMDDLDTVGAIRELGWLARRANGNDADLEVFSASARLLGLGIASPKLSVVFSSTVEYLVARRSARVETKDWSAADAIRGELSEMGISLADAKNQASGERITTWRVSDVGLAVIADTAAMAAVDHGLTFAPGDQVVYPMHGVGVIAHIEDFDVLGVTLKYCAIDFDRFRLRLQTPVAKAVAYGMRKATDAEIADHAAGAR